MTPDDVSKAIVQAILQGGMQWVVSTIAALLPAMWVITVILHLARPYMLRTIRKLSLRFGADIWWLGYVLVRDAVMLVTFSLSLVFLFPNLVTTIALPLTAPVAGLLLFASLYVKLLYDTDDDYQAYRVATLLLAVGGTFYFVPQIFAIESTSQGWLSGVVRFMTSTSNTAWMSPILVICMLGYATIGTLIFYQVAISGHRFGQRPEAREEPRAA
jgi:hypothetical protein